jgi:hypothetical protein
MSAPQMKERPASLLRAMFAGFGSLMSVVDKVRSKPAAEAPATATPSPAPEETVTPTETAASAAAAAPEETAAPAAVVTETAAPETSAAAETVAAETTVTQTAAEPASSAVEPEAPAASAPSGELPLANYDELTVASLRARLRNLSNDDLTQLMTYEKAHQNRPEVIKMFQNRLIKMTSGLPKLES